MKAKSTESKHIEIDRNVTSKKVFVFFGGIAAGIAVPPFEFYKSASILEENKIFVRDLSQSWYLDGLPGLSSDLFSTAIVLKKEIEKLDVDEVIWVGNSMGGWAAIAFCKLLGIGQAIAFAPQTTIHPLDLLVVQDFRWLTQISRTYRKTLFKKKIYDISTLFPSESPNNRVSIFVDQNDKKDYFHAKRLAGFTEVQVFEFQSGGHEIVKYLKENNLLSEIMKGSYRAAEKEVN